MSKKYNGPLYYLDKVHSVRYIVPYCFAKPKHATVAKAAADTVAELKYARDNDLDGITRRKNFSGGNDRSGVFGGVNNG